ncbi:MAG: MarR family winged helix-turn-helix transcriptional regulator [Eubacteriales bacterium]|jgi:DNA-binding MarR family transcriptional regulator
MKQQEAILGKIFAQLPRFFWKVSKVEWPAKEYRVNVIQIHILAALVNQGSLSMSSVAQRLNMSKQQATQTVNRMEELGVIRREQDPQDRRRINIVLSDKGMEVAHKLQEIMTRQVEKALAVLSEEDRRELEDSIDRMNMILSKL